MTQIQLIGFKSNHFEENDPKRNMSMHNHTTLELSYIVSGELILNYIATRTQETHTLTLHKQQLLIIKPGCMHYTIIPQKLESLGVEFSVPDNNIIPYLLNSSYVNNLPYAHEFLEELEDIVVIEDSQNIGYCLNQLKHYLPYNELNIFQQVDFELTIKKVLLEIVKCIDDEHVSIESNIYIRKAISIIQNKINQTITIDYLAKKLNISPVYLQKLFHKHLNTTVANEINRIKIEKAKHYISKTNFLLKDISAMLGYNSPQIFIANFKKFTGMSPNEFKKQEQHHKNLTIFIPNETYYKTEKKL